MSDDGIPKRLDEIVEHHLGYLRASHANEGAYFSGAVGFKFHGLVMMDRAKFPRSNDLVAAKRILSHLQTARTEFNELSFSGKTRLAGFNHKAIGEIIASEFEWTRPENLCEVLPRLDGAVI